jgi:hypothetical protein
MLVENKHIKDLQIGHLQHIEYCCDCDNYIEICVGEKFRLDDLAQVFWHSKNVSKPTIVVCYFEKDENAI